MIKIIILSVLSLCLFWIFLHLFWDTYKYYKFRIIQKGDGRYYIQDKNTLVFWKWNYTTGYDGWSSHYRKTIPRISFNTYFRLDPFSTASEAEQTIKDYFQEKHNKKVRKSIVEVVGIYKPGFSKMNRKNIITELLQNTEDMTKEEIMVLESIEKRL